MPARFIRPVAISPIYFSPSQLTSFPSNVVAFIWQRQFVCRINFAVWRNYCKSERRKKEGETKAAIIMHYAVGTSAEVELVFGARVGTCIGAQIERAAKYAAF